MTKLASPSLPYPAPIISSVQNVYTQYFSNVS